jgi:hypothetical protein
LIFHRRERSRCGIEVGGQHGFWAGTTPIKESIARRSRRSRRGDFGVDGQHGFWGTSPISESHEVVFSY